ncbi:MAG: hypothetical protein UW68_C0032G0011 [Candidatus Collierbacteria bacterium GW2011_GWB1_44_6]|uniref:Uncharacterized protein n=2 Tax=Candidatus Collieribacteriota TaxID=1752725 RepID=A0A0G1JMJ5_9BACT|nr:MAG: hypothetical protein UV68_C0018G0004 [Candidatus Collierbacteria bacterium GW2011_GWC2_43_12]KKT72588.1 MAG: hypothetical protein UW68_C0032G0011 [Candidatus Collierbacteria bacterium GW2011_GWB1_44_6]KKT83436.1 MAG: hypothetical protein UW80_C0014G0015 [Microgenomates group bacterium GW2011_GWC1_44_9]
MPKKRKIVTIDIEKSVMTKIKSNQITMKPRWYFVLGTIFSLVGLVSTGLVAVFLTNLTIFLLKQHGPNGQWRLQQILESFPLWIPLLAIVGIVGGIWLLKKFDFSYQKNFPLIVLVFITSILLAAFLLNYMGLDNLWMKQGPMRRFYQNNGGQVSGYPNITGQGRGRMIINR